MHVLLVVDQQSASADRSIAHNLAYKTIGLTEKSMQNMQTGLQTSDRSAKTPDRSGLPVLEQEALCNTRPVYNLRFIEGY